MQTSFEDDVLRGLNGPQLALDLHRHLTPDLRRVIVLRANDAELNAITEDQQVAISTAHQRVATAVKWIRKQARKRRIGPDALRPMLTALAE
jgi:hypothetical protein